MPCGARTVGPQKPTVPLCRARTNTNTSTSTSISISTGTSTNNTSNNMSAALAKDREQRFVYAVSRALVDTPLHARARCSDRLRVLKEAEEKVAEDADKALAAIAEKKKAKKAAKALPAPPPPPEAVKLSQIGEDEKSYLLDWFDLNDDDPEASDVDPREVTKLVLDEVSETLEEEDWWKLSRDLVLHEVAGLPPAPGEPAVGTVRELSAMEQLWRDLLGYQPAQAWEHCQRAAALAGRLLLFEWQRDELYKGVLKGLEVHAFAFPDRFFGGIYGRDQRRYTSTKLKPLYEKHRNLVQAAVGYALSTRDRLLVLGGGGLARGDLDPEVVSSESKADRLVLEFFPWVEAQALGRAGTICPWDTFQRDLKLFAEVYDTFWREKRIVLDEKTGVLHELPDHLCTWDRLTEHLSEYKTVGDLRKAMDVQHRLRQSLGKHRAAAAQIAAERGAGAGDGSQGGGGGGGSGSGDGSGATPTRAGATEGAGATPRRKTAATERARARARRNRGAHCGRRGRVLVPPSLARGGLRGRPCRSLSRPGGRCGSGSGRPQRTVQRRRGRGAGLPPLRLPSARSGRSRGPRRGGRRRGRRREGRDPAAPGPLGRRIRTRARARARTERDVKARTRIPTRTRTRTWKRSRSRRRTRTRTRRPPRARRPRRSPATAGCG